MSLPLRECGLKLILHVNPWRIQSVTPLAGVWIEIGSLPPECRDTLVTPLAGVWIEMTRGTIPWFASHSHSPCGSVD